MNKTSENSMQKQRFDTKTLRRLLSYMKDYKGQLILWWFAFCSAPLRPLLRRCSCNP